MKRESTEEKRESGNENVPDTSLVPFRTYRTNKQTNRAGQRDQYQLFLIRMARVK
jgi:hypothetical protein